MRSLGSFIFRLRELCALCGESSSLARYVRYVMSGMIRRHPVAAIVSQIAGFRFNATTKPKIAFDLFLLRPLAVDKQNFR